MQIFNKNWPDSKFKQKLELLLLLLLNLKNNKIDKSEI